MPYLTNPAYADYLSDTVVPASIAKGYAPVTVPRELRGDVGSLLTSFANYIQAKGLHHRFRVKTKGGHVTEWWLYVVLDSHKSDSEMQFGESTFVKVLADGRTGWRTSGRIEQLVWGGRTDE